MTANFVCAAGAGARVEGFEFRVQSDAVSSQYHPAVAERDCSRADVAGPPFGIAVVVVAAAAEAAADVQRIAVSGRQEASEEGVFVAAAAQDVVIANAAALATAGVQVRVLVQEVTIVAVPPQARAYVAAPAKSDDVPVPANADRALSL